MKIDLTKEEIVMILKDIECNIDSIRTDDGNTDEITFDVKNFDIGDYARDNVELMGKLYAKLRPLIK